MKAKAILVSDTHNEYLDDDIFTIPKIDGVKFLLLCGDIGSYKKHLPFIKECTKNYHVIYILGNHEFYGYSLEEVRQFWKTVKMENFTFLDNSEIVIDGIRFIGSTLWSSFNNSDPHCMINAGTEITDFRKIINKDGNDYFDVYEAYDEYSKAFNYIKEAIYQENDYVNVLLTHYGFSHQSVHDMYKQDLQSLKNNHYFTNNLDHLIGYSNLDFAFHGHLHHSSDYFIGNVRCICNPAGLPKKRNNEFYFKVIDLVKS